MTLGFPKPEKLPKKKKRVKNERRALSNKLDRLVSMICRKKGECEICGRDQGVLNAHHFISRKYHGVRWYLPNLVCLCVHCHTFSHKFSAHKTPEAFKARMIELRGKEWADDLNLRAIGHGNYKLNDLKELLKELQLKI